MVIEYHSSRNNFSIVSGIPVPDPTVTKWDVPSEDYLELVFLHQDRGFDNLTKKVTNP